MSDKIYYILIIITSLISLYFFFNIKKSNLKIIEKGLYLLIIIFIFVCMVFLPLALDIYTWFKGETGASPLFFITVLNFISLTIVGLLYKKILYLSDRVVKLEQQITIIDYKDNK